MKKGTEAIITVAQRQALQTNWIKHAIDKQDISPKCRIFNTDQSETHITSGFEGLEQYSNTKLGTKLSKKGFAGKLSKNM